MFKVHKGARVRLVDDAAGSEAWLVPTRGALVGGFRVGARDLLYLDEATLQDPGKNVRGGVPLLFPSPGKLEGDAWARGGKQGAMKQHGFARDLPWEVRGVSEEGAARVMLALTSNDETRARYPWAFSVELGISLSGTTLHFDLRVTNEDQDPMPFGFGVHPYFLVADKARARIPTSASRAYDNVKKEEVAFHGLDLTAKEVDMHLVDHGRTDAALSWGDGSTLTITGSPEFTRWVVWTLQGKDFVCLEPWTCPGNALNSGKGLLELPPGATRALSLALRYDAA